ncbi:MAG: alpha/beta hydrolase, partial [Pseudomonadota bacterium]
VDQRGTGSSNKMSCPELADEDFGQDFDAAVVQRLTRECLEQLPGDPRFYTTSVAVQDLDAVRAALGFEQLNLWGGSYGTRVALHYLRRYPEHVRSVIIDGVAPSDDVLGPDIAIDAQQSVEAAFDRCAESPACAAEYGDLGETLRDLRARLTAAPVEATVLHPRTGALETETMTDELLAGVVRLSAYKPLTRALLPTLIQRAHDGDYTMLAAQGLLLADSFADAMAVGMHNAVVCTEDAPFFPDTAPAALDDTFMGRFQLDYLIASCDVWPAGVIDDDFKDPVTSDTPVLILSGEFDPVTPPANGEAALATLSNARHLVASQQGHIVSGVGCMPRLLDEFVTTLDLTALDASCLDRVGGMPFFLNAIGPTP